MAILLPAPPPPLHPHNGRFHLNQYGLDHSVTLRLAWHKSIYTAYTREHWLLSK